jgi:hypothetical protein
MTKKKQVAKGDDGTDMVGSQRDGFSPPSLSLSLSLSRSLSFLIEPLEEAKSCLSNNTTRHQPSLPPVQLKEEDKKNEKKKQANEDKK